MRPSLTALRHIRRSSALAVAIGLLAPLAQAATTFSFSQGFPGGNPGSGTWNYIEKDISGESILTNMTSAGYNATPWCQLPSVCATPVWNSPSQSNQVPAFWSNNTTTDWQSNGTCCQVVTWPKRCLLVHPGSGKDAVARFTVPPHPNGGSYTRARLKGRITDQDFNGGNGVDWSVELNGIVQPGFAGSLNSTSASGLSSATFPSQSLAVATGSIIDVVVKSNGDEHFDTTSVCGSITLN